MPRKDPGDPVIVTNRKAFHDYNVLERFETGIELLGTEVKSCRNRAVQINEGYARIERGQVILYNVHIAAYDFGNRFNHQVRQPRRLLMHKKEILKLAQWLNTKGGTLIPLKFYFKGGLVKVELAWCQGKTHADQRETMRKRDAEDTIRRALRK